MSPESVTSLVRRMVDAEEISRHARWGSGVQTSELVRVTLRAFRRAWKGRGEAHLSMTEPLSDRQQDLARDILNDLCPQVALVAQTTAQLIAGSVAAARAEALAVTMDQLSGRCATSAARYVERVGAAPEGPEVAELAAAVIQRVKDTTTPMSRESFAGAYAAAYDAEWASRGTANLAAYPPTQLLVGCDERPPLAGSTGTRENNLTGTDRSVHSRYCAYQPHRPVPFRSRSLNCTQSETRRSPSRDVGREEVCRACAPYGLLSPAHRATLRGTLFGLTDDLHSTQGSRTELAVDGYCATLTHDGETYVALVVHRIVRQRLAPRQSHGGSGGTLPLREDGASWTDDVQGLTPAHLDRIAIVVMRRVWKALHGLELHVEEPACSCSLQATVKVSLDRAVPAALHRWDDAMFRCGSADAAGPEALDSEACLESLIERQNATFKLVADRADIARDIVAGRAGWRIAYTELTASTPERYFSPEEFAEWCREVVPGVADDWTATS